MGGGGLNAHLDITVFQKIILYSHCSLMILLRYLSYPPHISSDILYPLQIFCMILIFGNILYEKRNNMASKNPKSIYQHFQNIKV